MAPARRRKRQRGSIEKLPSGALRVAVYAGLDAVTGRRHYLREVVPPGPTAEAEADKAIRRLAAQVDERRHPRTSATLDQLLDRYLETLDVGRTTHRMYTRYLEKHVRPFVGRLKAGSVDAEVLDSLYAELRRCRDHCTGKRGIDHRTPRQHECDERCRPHACRPLSGTTIRHIHFVLRGAYEKGVRWRWVSVNPVLEASPPPARKPDPRPPSPEEAARIVTAAWESDPDWGMLVWLTMTTGARRGELCALRWSHVDLSTGVVTIRRAVAQDGRHREEKDTKTHQQRRVALDPETVALLREHRGRCEARVEALGESFSSDAFVFSLSPEGREHLVPSSVSQRYGRLVKRLGIQTHLHNLRHYSATELIAAGVDVRTVAGRLGHSGGGITTLRVYAAWLSESDQRAAAGLAARMPARPREAKRTERAMTLPKTPRERLAAELREQILTGAVPVGGHLPSIKQLARERGLSVSTVHRSFALLREWGLVDDVPGMRPRVLAPATATGQGDPSPGDDVSVEDEPAESSAEPELFDLQLRHRGAVVARFSTILDPRSGHELEQVLVDAVARRGGDEARLAEYELDVRRPGDDQIIITFVALRAGPRARRDLAR
jgi:integrase